MLWKTLILIETYLMLNWWMKIIFKYFKCHLIMDDIHTRCNRWFEVFIQKVIGHQLNFSSFFLNHCVIVHATKASTFKWSVRPRKFSHCKFNSWHLRKRNRRILRKMRNRMKQLLLQHILQSLFETVDLTHNQGCVLVAFNLVVLHLCVVFHDRL